MWDGAQQHGLCLIYQGGCSHCRGWPCGLPAGTPVPSRLLGLLPDETSKSGPFSKHFLWVWACFPACRPSGMLTEVVGCPVRWPPPHGPQKSLLTAKQERGGSSGCVTFRKLLAQHVRGAPVCERTRSPRTGSVPVHSTQCKDLAKVPRPQQEGCMGL